MKFADPWFLALIPVIAALLLGLQWYASQKTPRGASVAWHLMILRLLTLTTLGLALAAPYYEHAEEHSSAVALVDISESMDEAVGQSLLRRLEAFHGEKIELDLYPFAGEADATPVSLSDYSSYRSLKGAWSKLNIGATDLERALDHATAANDSSIILLSDAFQTGGSLEKILPALTGRGSRVYALTDTVAAARQGNFRVTHLYAPLIAPSQKSVDVRVSVENTTTTPQSGVLTVTHDGKEVLNKNITVNPGAEALYVAQSDPAKEGIKEIVATLKPAAAPLRESSERIFLSGQSREKVLLISGEAEDERYLKQALQDQSYQLTAIDASRGTSSLPKLYDFSVVVLNNVALNQLPRDYAREVEQYTKDGGGFVMIGGNRGFGLGGYLYTPIADALPVEMVPPQTLKKRLNVAVELVLDKSRSMAEDEKLEYAKEAAREVIRNLKEDDYIGVIGFDSAPFTVVPIEIIQSARERAMDRIGRLFPTGRTNMFPAIDEARRGLDKVNAGRKHMIILTDGKIPDEGPYYLELVKQMRILGISVSTVMLGGEADIEMLRTMAELGGGAFYQTLDARNLPKIFLNDIRVTTGERSMKEDQDYPVREGNGELKSTEVRSFPPVRGYVETKPRAKANLELVAIANDKAQPLLASWSYGKGKSLAFTSDANGRWSSDWVRWSRFYNLWSDLIDSVRPDRTALADNIRFDLKHSYAHGVLTLDLSVFADEIPGAISGTLKLPDGTERPVPFDALSAGHYRANFDRVIAGKYELHGYVGKRKLTPVAFYLSGELFGERKGEGFNLPLLERITRATGGKINPAPAEVAQQKYRKVERHELGHMMLLLAALLIIAEILVREIGLGTMSPRPSLSGLRR